MPTHIPYQPKGRLKTAQAGITLIEVLISMFVLAIGVLALLAVQLRSVNGVREAETQTIVSQITQNLIEGMLVNPTLTPDTDDTGAETGSFRKSYTAYAGSGKVTETGNSMPASNTTVSQAALAEAQIAQFRNDLAAALPERDIWFSICRDASGAAPTYENGNVNYHCDDNANGNTVIKVLWLHDSGEDSEETDSNLASSDGQIVYTHQSRVGD